MDRCEMGYDRMAEFCEYMQEAGASPADVGLCYEAANLAGTQRPGSITECQNICRRLF